MPFEPKQAANFVGLTEEQAIILARQQGFTLQVTKREGTEYIHDQSLRADRVNVVIEDRKIISATIG